MTNTLDAHTRTHAHSVYLWAAHYAQLFALFEAVKAHRDAQWSGYDATAALGAALTAVLCFLAVGLGAAILGRGFDAVLHALRRGMPRVRFAADALAATLMAAGVWGVLSVHREFWPTAEDAAVLAAIVALPALGAVATGLGRRARARFHVSVAIVLGGALLALVVAGDALLFSPQRAELVVLAAALALALGAVWMGATWTWRHAAGWCALGMGLLLLWGLPLSMAVAMRSAPPPPAAAPPNVLFVVADTLRASALQLHGGPQPAPALEALAARGVRFDQAQAPAPWTLPSMTALLASQPPQGLTPGGSMGAWREELWYYAVSPAAPTLAEVLQAEGYATGAVCANQLLKVLPGARRGLDTWADVHPILLRQTGLWRAVPFWGAVVRHWLPGLDGVRPADTTAALTRYAEAYIRRHRDRPFYLWVHYMDPHAPYDPPPGLRPDRRGPWPFFYPYEGGERWGVPQVDEGLPMPEARDRAYRRPMWTRTWAACLPRSTPTACANARWWSLPATTVKSCGNGVPGAMAKPCTPSCCMCPGSSRGRAWRRRKWGRRYRLSTSCRRWRASWGWRRMRRGVAPTTVCPCARAWPWRRGRSLRKAPTNAPGRTCGAACRRTAGS